MVIKGAKSIAEYQIRKYLVQGGLVAEETQIKMIGREALVTDRNGDTMELIYDETTKQVYEKEDTHEEHITGS
ncbi:MAG: hypothetical protein NC541_14755 [bacterium]|nr:hypothetical protein [bacterium]